MRTEFKMKTLAMSLLVCSLVACTGKTAGDASAVP